MPIIGQLFTELYESHKMKMRLGDDKCRLKEKVLAIDNGHGKVKLLYNVFFILSLSQSLLSVDNS